MFPFRRVVRNSVVMFDFGVLAFQECFPGLGALSCDSQERSKEEVVFLLWLLFVVYQDVTER